MTRDFRRAMIGFILSWAVLVLVMLLASPVAAQRDSIFDAQADSLARAVFDSAIVIHDSLRHAGLEPPPDTTPPPVNFASYFYRMTIR